MGKVAIYSRVSTADKQSYERQNNELKRIIILDGYSEDDIDYYSEAISGYKKSDERRELSTLLNKIDDDPKLYDCVYTSEISRIGRQPTETRQIIDRLTELRVPIYIQTLGQKTLNNDSTRNSIMNIILQVLIEFADSEAETFKMRSRSGLLQSAKSGKAGGSKNLPYGYRKDDQGFLVVDKKEEIIIKDIFNYYKNGDGIRVIANTLNGEHTPTRANKAYEGKVMKFSIEKNADSIKWSDTQVHNILKNTIYKGHRRFKGETFISDNYLIISEELFDECTAIREGKTHRNYLTKYTYLLKDLMICGKCGRNYFAKFKPVKKGDKVYVCASRLKTNGNCGNAGINISLIESAIYNEIKNTDRLLKYINDTDEIRTELKSDITSLKNKKLITQNQLQSKIDKKARLLDLYLTTPDFEKSIYNDKNAEIDKAVSLLQNQLILINDSLYEKEKAIKNQSSKQATSEKIKDAKNNREELRSIIKQFIDKVYIIKIDGNIILAAFYIKIDGIVMRNPLKLFLDIGGIRKKQKKYRYIGFAALENDLVFKNNKLLVDVADIRQEFYSLISNDVWEDKDLQARYGYKTWQEIDDENIVTVL